jgi:hypothetical protein
MEADVGRTSGGGDIGDAAADVKGEKAPLPPLLLMLARSLATAAVEGCPLLCAIGAKKLCNACRRSASSSNWRSCVRVWIGREVRSAAMPARVCELEGDCINQD